MVPCRNRNAHIRRCQRDDLKHVGRHYGDRDKLSRAGKHAPKGVVCGPVGKLAPVRAPRCRSRGRCAAMAGITRNHHWKGTVMLANEFRTIEVAPGQTELGVIGDDVLHGDLVKQICIDTTLATGPVYVDGVAEMFCEMADELQIAVVGLENVVFRHRSVNTTVENRLNCPGGVDLVKAPDGAMRWWIRVGYAAGEYGFTNGED